MDSSQLWGFLKILSQSLKLVLRNAILIASITTLSMLLTSTLFLLFSFSYEFATNYITDSTSISGVFILQIIISFALPVAAEPILMLSYIAISYALSFATVTATAASYTDAGRLSLPDLFSRIRSKWRSPFRLRKNNIRGGSIRSRNPMHFLPIVAVAVAVPVVIFYPNPATIAVVAAIGVPIFVFNLYASVGSQLACIVLVVEDGCEAAEAVEKAEKLVEGWKVQGFMVNVLIAAVDLIGLVSLWMILGDRGSLTQNMRVYGLIFLNGALMTTIFVGVAYTVYFFHCKEYKSQLLGDHFNYTALDNDTP